MNQHCYVSHSPVSCSATDGKRDGERERQRELLSVRHVSHAAWRLCMTPKTTLLKRGSGHFHRATECTDLFFNHLNQHWSSEEGWEFLYVKGQSVQLLSEVTVATGSSSWSSVSVQPVATNSDRSVVICLPPGTLSPPPPPLLPLPLTLSHTHHPASPLKWDTSPRQQKGWWDRVREMEGEG